MIIEVLDSVQSRVLKDDGKKLIPCLSYPSYIWIPTRFKKVRKQIRTHLFNKGKKYWYFATGHVPRIMSYCQKIGQHCTLNGNYIDYIPSSPPKLPGITLREDQIRLIKRATRETRGVIKAPTGSGKTIVQLGILSCYPDFNALILAHTIEIVEQTSQELRKFGFKNIQTIGGDNSIQPLRGDIVVSTRQSFISLNPKEYGDYFHVVIIDEAHHVSDPEGEYSDILSNLLAPIRLGFTATLPTDPKAQFALEGALGEVIGEQTIQEATELGILAKPRIRLVKSRYNALVSDQKSYSKVYSMGITKNRSRNKQIVEICSEYISKGNTVLIVVTHIIHGTILQEYARKAGINARFVQGETESDVRRRTKELFIQKKIPCVICTAVWREGINIPSLNVVVNAAGGKSEIMTLQTIGRGLRRTDDKKEVIIVDFFDPSHHFLISHFGERITLYMDNNWL